MHTENNDEPDPYTLADEDDELGWDVEKHGRFKDCVAEPPPTELWVE